MARVVLLVLYAYDIEKTAEFYAALGFAFVRERHGRGPAHYAAEQDGFVLEIYPSGDPCSPMRLQVDVDDLEEAEAQLTVLGFRPRSEHTYFDPDGRIVVIAENKTPLIH